MQTYESYRGIRHRTLVLMYIVWLTLSLAPAMYAPPERSLPKGQPELQQAMDNMVTRQTTIQKRTSRSTGDESHYKELNLKTSTLLADAENVLKNLPDSKERLWIESFIGKMKEIASVLEKIAQQKNLDITSTPVPEGLPKQPSRPATSAVPKMKPFQKPDNSMSKNQTTSEISRVLPVNDDHAERETVTKPVALSSKVESESDELVRELESLHEENTSQVLAIDSKMDNHVLAVTTDSSHLPSEDIRATPLKKMAEKAKLKAKLMEEIDEFHRIGGVMPKEVIDILYSDSHKLTDPAQDRNINIDEKMKFTESGMIDRHGMLRMDDVNNEDKKISMVNSKNIPYYPGQQYMKFNPEFQNKHPNFVQAYPKPTGQYFQNVYPFNVAQPYQGRPQNVNQNLPKIGPFNQEKYINPGMQHQSGLIPDALKQKLPKPHIFYNGRVPASGYNNYYMRRNYGPYPYMPNWNTQNATNHLPQMTAPHVANQAKIDTQLSDEMKRELRDGKIIVLSDSVVRSNFEADNKDKAAPSMTKKPETQEVEMKNETTTEI